MTSQESVESSTDSIGQAIVEPSPEWLQSMLRLAKMMSDESRSSIMSAIIDPARHTSPDVLDLAAAANLSQPATSGHLRKLRMNGHVDFTRQGKHNSYHPTQAFWEDVRTYDEFVDALNARLEESQND